MIFLKNLAVILVCVGLFHACQSTPTSDSIRLNGGEKWKVNVEMKPHIQRGHEILKEYYQSKSSDHQALAERLRHQNNLLIQSCTMKGESHDELHKWLHPHMNLIDQLDKANNEKAAEELVSQLQVSFQTYHKFFE